MVPSINTRFAIRNRGPGLAKAKANGDENATSKHVRQPSGIAVGTSRLAGIAKNNTRDRPVLHEVTKTEEPAVRALGKDLKEKETTDSTETSLKRSRSSSLAAALGPQRVPLGPGRIAPVQAVQATAHARGLPTRVQKSQATRQRKPPVVHIPPHLEDDQEQSMDIEEASAAEEDSSMMAGTQEVEAMVDLDDSEDEDDQHVSSRSSAWPTVSPERADRYKREVEAIREVFEDEQDMFDTTMVSEYAEEIFF